MNGIVHDQQVFKTDLNYSCGGYRLARCVAERIREVKYVVFRTNLPLNRPDNLHATVI